MYSEGRKVRNSVVITKYEDIVKIKNKNDKDNNHSEVESIIPLSNNHSALIANTAFKNKKEITNKRIVKAISKYKPSINVPTINKVEEGSFNIYKSAHLDFCRNCLIPKDVLHFQGLLLFKNMSKLKGMNLSRQQINNALEWEVIRYTVFNNKSTDNWSNLLNQYKSDRTSTKILSKRYAARRQGQKSVKKETESFERKYIAYNIIKKKAPTLANYFNSESEVLAENSGNSNSSSSNNNENLILTKFPYNDISSPEDFKRIVSKVIEQRVKVTSKHWTVKSSPLKESTTIDYTTKIIKNKSKNHLKSLCINDITGFIAYIYPHKLIKIDDGISLINDEDELEIMSNIFCCNVTILNVLYNNQDKNDFNNLMSCYLYYLLNIFYISLPHNPSEKMQPKKLNLEKSEILFVNLINLIINNNYYNQYENFIDYINNLSKLQSLITSNSIAIKNEKLKNIESYHSLLEIPEKSKLMVIPYLLHYILSSKNKLFTLTYNSKKIKIVYLIFMPLISYATNKLNVQYLKHHHKFYNYKKQMTHSKKWLLKSKYNNDLDKKKSNNNYINQEKLNKYRHSLINKIVSILPSSEEVKSHYNSIHQKINYLLPELNKDKSLNYCRKLMMNSYITYISLRQRKNCVSMKNRISQCDDDKEKKDHFFINHMNIKKQNDYKKKFVNIYLRYIMRKKIRKMKKRKFIKAFTMKKNNENIPIMKKADDPQIMINKAYYHTTIKDENSNKGFFYSLKKRYQEKNNNFKKNLLIRNDKNNSLKSNMLVNTSRINRSKTNLLKNEALKIYEIYDNPDEDKIKYIKRVYKKKYKKLISNEIKNKSDTIILNNCNNKEDDKEIFYLELYNTKNKIIDLNKNTANEASTSEANSTTDTNGKITVEFIKKKYNIIDLNQRINNSNPEIKKEPKSIIKPIIIPKINMNRPSLSLTSSPGIVNIDTKSIASLSLSEVNSKETVNHLVSKKSYNIYEKENNKFENNTSQTKNANRTNSFEFEKEKKIEKLNMINTINMNNKSLSLRSLLRSFSTIPYSSSPTNNIENDNNNENKKLSNSLNTESINIPTSLKSTEHTPNENFTILPFHKTKIFVKKRNFSK